MGLSIISTPVLSRIFSPEAYGEWGVFSSVSMILGSVLFLSYENAIVRVKEERELPAIIWLCIISTLAVILFTVFVFWVGSWFNIKFFVDYPSVPLLVVVLLLTSLDVLFTNVSNRYSQYNTMTFAGIANGVSQPLSRIVFGLIPFSKGLIYGNILGLIVKIGYFLIKSKKYLINILLKPVPSIEIKNAAIDYKKFPLYDAPARLIEFVIGNIVIIILSVYFNLEEIGCFSMVAQLVQAPLILMGSSMSTVYFKDLAVVAGDKEQIAVVSRRTTRVCLIMAISVSLFFVAGGDCLVVLFLGHKWALAGDMSLCLTIFSIPVVLSEPLMPIFKVLDKQNLRFWLNIVNLALTVGALFVGAYFVHNILLVLVLYSICYATLRFVMFSLQLKLVTISFFSFKKETIAITFIYIILGVRLFLKLL